MAAFLGCASLVRQFEFVQNVWINDPTFHELGNERDPIIGTQDGTYDMTIPKRPIRKKIKGLPAFTTVKGGAYFFLPGIRALRYLAALSRDIRTKRDKCGKQKENDMNQTKSAPRTYNQTHVPRKYSAGRRRFSVYISWSYPGEANRDVTDNG